MRNKTPAKHALVGLLQNARYEVLPTPSTEDKVLASVPADGRHALRDRTLLLFLYNLMQIG